MKRKTLFLICAIVSALLFIGMLSETDPKTFFGYSISIWFYTAFWLLNTFILVKAYLSLLKTEKEKN